jgi:hypothetical protein
MKTFDVTELYTIDGYQNPDGYDLFDGYEVVEYLDGYEQGTYLVLTQELQRISEYIQRLNERKNSIMQLDVSDKKTKKLARVNSEIDHYVGLNNAIAAGNITKKINTEFKFDNSRVAGDVYQAAINSANAAKNKNAAQKVANRKVNHNE